MMEKIKNYNKSVDGLRVVSILAVLIIHTSTKILGATGNNLLQVPWTFLLNQSTRFAVPLFFMISGFVLELSNAGSLNYVSFLRKRVDRILVPYVFWSAIYFWLIYPGGNNFLSALRYGSASYQLYFIPTLIVFYLIFPLLHIGFKIISNKVVMTILGGIQFGLLYYVYFVKALPFSYPISIALLNFYVFILGMVVSHHQEKLLAFLLKWKKYLVIGTLFMVGYVTWEGRSRFLSSHNYLDFYTQWRISIFIYTLLLAGVLYTLFDSADRISTLMKKLSQLSFFVFLFHIIALEYVWNLVMKYLGQGVVYQVWFDGAFFGIVALISFMAALVAHKIPLVARITG